MYFYNWWSTDGSNVVGPMIPCTFSVRWYKQTLQFALTMKLITTGDRVQRSVCPLWFHITSAHTITFHCHNLSAAWCKDQDLTELRQGNNFLVKLDSQRVYCPSATKKYRFWATCSVDHNLLG